MLVSLERGDFTPLNENSYLPGLPNLNSPPFVSTPVLVVDGGVEYIEVLAGVVDLSEVVVVNLNVKVGVEVVDEGADVLLEITPNVNVLLLKPSLKGNGVAPPNGFVPTSEPVPVVPSLAEEQAKQEEALASFLTKQTEHSHDPGATLNISESDLVTLFVSEVLETS